MLFVGVDLTSAYARKPRSIDVAILDDDRRCEFASIAWPEADLVRRRAWEPLWEMLGASLAAGHGRDVVWAIDGPQGLARRGHSMRACERKLRTPGKTPDQLPEDRPGGKPFADYVRSGVDLFATLIGRKGLRLVGLDTESLEKANLFEVFPGAEWDILAGRKLPKKTTGEGKRDRREVLESCGLSGLPARLGHDHADAAVSAYLAWCTRHAPDRVELIGDPPFRDEGEWREGFILHAATSAARHVEAGAKAGRAEPRAIDSIDVLTQQLREFVRERDWEKFHAPKNLAMALAVEAAELMEHFQWMSANESSAIDAGTRAKVAEEIGDALIYLARLADRLGIDPLSAAADKLQKNRLKYPAAIVRGKAKKYSDY